ncbi:MAG TPA: TIGR03435 family protein [Vicinamibacterales bacterium]|nr:TIGR03435 family protein [Vicinamibacterales bacterium]
MKSLVAAALIAAVSSIESTAEAPQAPAQFDIVSIKKNTSLEAGGGMRSLPDGTSVMVNQPIRSLIMVAAPVPVREVEGLPDWAMQERYDITTKPPAGSTREQRSEMMRTMFEERMKLKAHVEQRERDIFALVVARSDGRLGPQLKPSTLDCSPRPPGTPPPPPPTSFSEADAQGRCGGLFGQGVIVSGGILLDSLVLSISGLAGRQVINRSGLQGFYALTLRFALPRGPGAATGAAADDNLPDFFTALQEQLGLKLQPEKATIPIFVIDHIERPTEN